MTAKIEADVRTILHQSLNPVLFRRGLAERHGVAVEIVDAIIAQIGGTPRKVDPEVLAQERLEQVRAMKPTDRREYDHEED